MKEKLIVVVPKKHKRNTDNAFKCKVVTASWTGVSERYVWQAWLGAKSGSALGKECLCGLAGRGSSKVCGDELAGVQDALKIHSMLYTQAIEQEEHIFCGHIAGSSLGIRAAPQASY